MNETTDQAAADRVRAYLDGRARFTHLSDQIAEAKNGGSPWAYLTVTDLESLLAEREALTRALRVERLRCQSAERLLAMAPDVGVFEQLTGAPQPARAAPQRHAGAPGPVETDNGTAQGYEAPQGAAESCGHCGLPIAEGARGTAYGIALHHTCTNPPQADPIDCYRLVTVYGEPIGARIIAPEDEGISTADVLAQIAADEATEHVPGYRDVRREQHPKGGE